MPKCDFNKVALRTSPFLEIASKELKVTAMLIGNQALLLC